MAEQAMRQVPQYSATSWLQATFARDQAHPACGGCGARAGRRRVAHPIPERGVPGADLWRPRDVMDGPG